MIPLIEYARVHDFNPRPPCGGRRVDPAALGYIDVISIHVPRAGDDVVPVPSALYWNISIHVPRAGDDPCA